MTMTSWPYVAQDTTDIEYGRLYSEMAATDGIVGSHGSAGLLVSADSSARSVRMAAGSAMLRGYMFHSTAIETIPVAAPSAGNRVDLLCLELNLSAPTIAERILPKILLGTSGSPNPPSLTQTDTGIYQLGLSFINVDAGITVIAADKVTDARSWADQKYGAWTTSRRPTAPRKYKLGFNTTLSAWEYYDGAGWVSLVGVSLSGSNVTGVLPVAKGGTGEITADAALKALGVYVQAAQPAYAAGRVWVKIPA